MKGRKEHYRFMARAIAEAEKALAQGEFPVGCVFVRDGQILAAGHRRNSGMEQGNEIDHAEMVVLRELVSDKPSLDLAGTTVYSSMEPCLMCFSTLILSGVRHIVYAYEDVMGGGCGLDLTQLPPLYRQMEVKIVDGILRKQSLELFKRFFSLNENHYWQDSLLASYTLSAEL
ncbi:MAG: tRNA-specific adenosine deaminase [Desulfobacterales bacterium]|nr:MAG: tRNA-specific adenosine deaminase [Desulfobacterales bacterium]